MADSIAPWLREDFLLDYASKKFDLSADQLEPSIVAVAPVGKCGDNFTSNVVKAEFQFKAKQDPEDNDDAATEDEGHRVLAFVKRMSYPYPEMRMMGFFKRECAAYERAIPRFELMWREVGEEVQFASKLLRVELEPEELMALEDLSIRGFRICQRLEGIDFEHSLKILETLAKFHAASAVDYEKNGSLDPSFDYSILTIDMGEMSERFWDYHGIYVEAIRKNFGDKFADKIAKWPKVIQSAFVHAFGLPSEDRLRVLCHGDVWTNNLMFSYDAAGQIKDLIFVDFQLSCYQSPAVDLLYFIFSSTRLDDKVARFEEFIGFYHQRLVECLERLSYAGKIPTLRDLYVELFERSAVVVFILLTMLPIVVLPSQEDMSIADLAGAGQNATLYKKIMYENPAYIEQLEILLPFLDSKGWLDY